MVQEVTMVTADWVFRKDFYEKETFWLRRGNWTHREIRIFFTGENPHGDTGIEWPSAGQGENKPANTLILDLKLPEL